MKDYTETINGIIEEIRKDPAHPKYGKRLIAMLTAYMKADRKKLPFCDVELEKAKLCAEMTKLLIACDHGNNGDSPSYFHQIDKLCQDTVNEALSDAPDAVPGEMLPVPVVKEDSEGPAQSRTEVPVPVRKAEEVLSSAGSRIFKNRAEEIEEIISEIEDDPEHPKYANRLIGLLTALGRSKSEEQEENKLDVIVEILEFLDDCAADEREKEPAYLDRIANLCHKMAFGGAPSSDGDLDDGQISLPLGSGDFEELMKACTDQMDSDEVTDSDKCFEVASVAIEEVFRKADMWFYNRTTDDGDKLFDMGITMDSCNMRLVTILEKQPAAYTMKVILPIMPDKKYADQIYRLVGTLNRDMRIGYFCYDERHGEISFFYGDTTDNFDGEKFDRIFNILLTSAARHYSEFRRYSAGKFTHDEMKEITARMDVLRKDFTEWK